MKRVILLVACLLAATPAIGTAFEDVPVWLGKFELADIGLCYPMLVDGRALRFTFLCHRLRFGVAVSEADFGMAMRGLEAVVPLHIGFTLYTRPLRNRAFYGMAPDVYVEAAGSAWGRVPYLRGTACACIERPGIGLALETGLKLLDYRDEGHGTEPPRQLTYPYVSLSVRLLTFTFGV